MTVINACQQPVVAVKIPKVDDMLQRAQDKVDVIKRVQAMTAGARPIDEVVFVQNVPTHNPEWPLQRRKSHELLGDAGVQVRE